MKREGWGPRSEEAERIGTACWEGYVAHEAGWLLRSSYPLNTAKVVLPEPEPRHHPAAVSCGDLPSKVPEAGVPD